MARVLGARTPGFDDGLGGDDPADDGLDHDLGLGQGDSAGAGGWVPPAPGSSSSSQGRLSQGTRSVTDSTAAAVRRLAARATDDEVSRLDADLRRARRPGLLTVPDELRSGRRSVSSAALVSLLALVVAVGCAFVLRVLWAERSASSSEPAPGPGRSVQVVGGPAAAATSTPRTAAGGAAGPGATTGASAASGAGGGSSAAPSVGPEIVVHVVGQVARPGLVRLRAGARVADAIRQAGGARAGADVGALNLARPVVDGEQVRVPRPGESVAPPAVAQGSGDSGAATAGSSTGAPVSLNTSDAAALDSLPGVGPVLAQRIIDWRAEHGRFTSVDELGEVSGIGDKLLSRLRAQVTL